MYDSCRYSINSMPSLFGEARKNSLALGDSNEEQDDEVCWYFHASACGPGGITDADSKFAKRLHDHSVAMFQKKPVGKMEFPGDWLRIKISPGEIKLDGGDDYVID